MDDLNKHLLPSNWLRRLKTGLFFPPDLKMYGYSCLLDERAIDRSPSRGVSTFTLQSPPGFPDSIHRGFGAHPGNRSSLEGRAPPSICSGRTLRSLAEDMSWRRYLSASEGSLIPAL